MSCFFEQQPPPFQQRLEIWVRDVFFCWPLQNLLKFGQIINIRNISSANFLHIKQLQFQKTLPPQACAILSQGLLLVEPYVASFTEGESISWILSLVRDSSLFLLLCAGQREGRNQGQNSGQVVLWFLRCKWPPATTQAAWRMEFERQNWGKMRSRIRSTSLVRGSRECE